MTADPPKYRPLERFWPYADLPEQPTEEELASLDPDLHEALFGERPRPFSITLVFPHLDVPAFAAALDLARASAEFAEAAVGDARPRRRARQAVRSRAHSEHRRSLPVLDAAVALRDVRRSLGSRPARP